jgi:hypothetical protein
MREREWARRHHIVTVSTSASEERYYGLGDEKFHGTSHVIVSFFFSSTSAAAYSCFHFDAEFNLVKVTPWTLPG